MRGGDVGYSRCRFFSPGGWVRATDGRCRRVLGVAVGREDKLVGSKGGINKMTIVSCMY